MLLTLINPGNPQYVRRPGRSKGDTRCNCHHISYFSNILFLCNTNSRDNHITKSMKIFCLNSVYAPGQHKSSRGFLARRSAGVFRGAGSPAEPSSDLGEGRAGAATSSARLQVWLTCKADVGNGPQCG